MRARDRVGVRVRVRVRVGVRGRVRGRGSYLLADTVRRRRLLHANAVGDAEGALPVDHGRHAHLVRVRARVRVGVGVGVRGRGAARWPWATGAPG